MKLTKNLGFFALFSLAAGAMISSGLFVLPSIAYREAGPPSILSYILAAILMLPSVLSKAELATAMTRSGGDYFYVDRILGTPAGVIAGFANWFSIALKSSFALIGIGAFAILVFPDFTNIKLVAVGFCVFFALLNLVSVKTSGKFQVIFVIFLLSALAAYIILGYPSAKPEFFRPFNVKKYVPILEATGLVFISYAGLTKIDSVAEESKEAGRLIPKAMLWAYTIVSILYVLVVAVTIGVLPHKELTGTLTPISAAAKVFAGTPGMIVMAVAAMAAFITTANAGILAASRVPMAMSRDYLLPKIFGHVSKRFGTPWFSILVTSSFMIFVVVFLEVEMLAKVASTFMILLFIMVNFSLIVVRYAGIRNYRPTFKSPLFPWMQIFAIIAYSILIAQMGKIPLLITVGFIVFAYIWYRVFFTGLEKRHSALIRLAMNILNRIIISETNFEKLENELLGILKERENIEEDEFDRLIQNAHIMDQPEAIDRERFFHQIAEDLTPRLNLTQEQIFSMFCDREVMSNTNIIPGVAVPHIILEGSDRFDVVLVRNRHGIRWNDDSEPVHAVFVLLGTMDQRDLHLRALMAIAQMLQGKTFMDQWMDARDAEDLRSTILLTKRQRKESGK